MANRSEKEKLFNDTYEANRGLIGKVCYIYATDTDHYHDLYQEVLLNLWANIDSFRGQSKISTWLYRLAINTCLNYLRKDKRQGEQVAIEEVFDIADENPDTLASLAMLQEMIATLSPIEKAIVTLWLDENSYEEIAKVTGLTKANVAVKFHRIKQKLSKLGSMD